MEIREVQGRFLYVVRQKDADPACVKVGIAKWPETRFRGIQVGCPFDLELYAWFDGLSYMERRVHEVLKPWWMRGEWFLLTAALQEQLMSKLIDVAERRHLDWWEIRMLTTWKEIDEELDAIEAEDFIAIANVFCRFRDRPILQNGRRGRVNLSNFSRHVGMQRHQLESWCRDAEQMKETA